MPSSGLRQCIRDVTPYLLLAIAISTLGPLQFGFHLAELNAPQDVISCRQKAQSLTSTLLSVFSRANGTKPATAADCIPMDDAAFAVVSSTFTVGGLIGALAAGPLSSARGRLLAMRLTSVFFIMGSIVETLASSIWVMSTGRFLSGIGAGAATVIVPLYISEIAPPNERGLFGFMTQISINIGILLTQTLGYFLSYGSMWRWVLGTGTIMGAAHAFGTLLLPESPAWTAANNSVPKARRTLQRIRGANYDIEEEVAAWASNPEDAEPEEEGLLERQGVSRYDSSNAKTSNHHLGFFQVVQDPLYRPAIIAVVGTMFSQQLCGINSIIMYSVSLLADLLPINSGVLTIIISGINLVATIACAPLPDKFGRKACILLSIAGQGTSALVLALSIVFGAKVLSAIAVLSFVAAFAVGLGPVPFILASELVGHEAVGATQSWALAASYTSTFLVAQFFPIINVALNKALGGAGWVYFIFAALALLCGIFVFFRVPETKGKKDADEVWGRTRRID